MKVRYIVALLLFTESGICTMIGAVFQSQCTQLNQLLGNCVNTLPWFALAGLGASVAVLWLAIALLTDEAHIPKL